MVQLFPRVAKTTLLDGEHVFNLTLNAFFNSKKVNVFTAFTSREGEKTLESLLDCKEIQPVHPKGDQSWVFIGRTDVEAETHTLATLCEELTHWKRLWCWEGLGAGGEEDDRGWDGWMASPTWWTWVWVNSGSWCWTGRPGVLRFMGLQRVRHDCPTELNWTDIGCL